MYGAGRDQSTQPLRVSDRSDELEALYAPKAENSRQRRTARRAAERALTAPGSLPATPEQRAALAALGFAPGRRPVTQGQAAKLFAASDVRATLETGTRAEPTQDDGRPATRRQRDMLTGLQRRHGLRTAIPADLTLTQASNRIEALKT